MTTPPSRNVGVTIPCPVCERPFVPVGRKRVCSAGLPPGCLATTPPYTSPQHPTPRPPRGNYLRVPVVRHPVSRGAALPRLRHLLPQGGHGRALSPLRRTRRAGGLAAQGGKEVRPLSPDPVGLSASPNWDFSCRRVRLLVGPYGSKVVATDSQNRSPIPDTMCALLARVGPFSRGNLGPFSDGIDNRDASSRLLCACSSSR